MCLNLKQTTWVTDYIQNEYTSHAHEQRDTDDDSLVTQFIMCQLNLLSKASLLSRESLPFSRFATNKTQPSSLQNFVSKYNRCQVKVSVINSPINYLIIIFSYMQ